LAYLGQTSCASLTSRSSTAKAKSSGCRSYSRGWTRCGSPAYAGMNPVVSEPLSSYMMGRIYGGTVALAARALARAVVDDGDATQCNSAGAGGRV
jgi:hypothetical protein